MTASVSAVLLMQPEKEHSPEARMESLQDYLGPVREQRKSDICGSKAGYALSTRLIF